MFIFISLGGGRNQWYAAPWAFVLMLLLNSGIVNDLLFNMTSLIAGGSDTQQEERSVELSVWWSPWAAMLITGVLAALLYKFSLMVRRQGFWQALNQIFFMNNQFPMRRNQNSASQRSNLETVSNIIQKLPTDTFVPEEELCKLPICKLKEKLTRCKVDTKGFSEKRDLVDALKKTTFVSNTTCSICCEDYAADDILRILPCNHTFHLECIDRWFLASTDYSRPTACPYCNFNISAAT